MKPKTSLDFTNFRDGVLSDTSQVNSPNGVLLRACNFDLQLNGGARLRPPLRREGAALFASASGDARGFVWDSPDGDTGTQFVITQVGDQFRVLQRTRAVGSAVADVTPATAEHVRNVLGTADVLGVRTDGTSAKIDVAFSGKYCIITGLDVENESEVFQECVLVLEYRRDTGDLLAWYDFIWVRDFFGLEDGRINGARTALDVGNDEVMYNLFNQGWWNVAKGTFPTNYVIRKFMASAAAADPDAICTLYTALGTGVDEEMPIDGVQAAGLVWAGPAQYITITADTTAGAGCVIQLTGKNAGGLAQTTYSTFTAGVVATHTSTNTYTELTYVSVTSGAPGATVTVGLKEQLPGDYDTWTLGVYADTATTRTFDPNFLLQAPEGTGKAPFGSYIVPLNYRSIPLSAGGMGRGVYEGQSRNIWYDESWTVSMPDDRSGRPNKTCFSVGRAWFSFTRNLCENETTHKNSPDVACYVAFSRIVNTVEDITRCYSYNDPTSPEFNEILADDGGFVRIQGAGEILALRPVLNGVLVVASNGVWHVTGDLNGGMSATSYQVLRVADSGCVAEDAVVQAKDTVVYLSRSGIEMVGPGDQGYLQVQSLTDTKNRALYYSTEDIETCKGAYDGTYKKIALLFTVSDEYQYEIDIDVDTGAVSTRTFVPGDYQIAGLMQFPIARVAEFSDGTQCPNAGYILNNGTNTYLGYLRYDDSDGSTYSWEDEGGAYNESSELFVGHISLGSLQLNKYVTYFDGFFERTEDTYTVLSGDATLNHESSCLVDAYWEWANTSTSQYKSSPFEAYRYRRPFLAESADGTYTFSYGQEVITTKNKLRGHGKTLAVRLRPSTNKDCRPLGWSVSVGANQ
jgi:hypothetical protein